jgi:hypothetical protein
MRKAKMKKIILGILAFTVLAGAASVQVQAATPSQVPAAAPASLPAMTADDIVSKNLDALGGKDAISKITSLSMDATMQVMGTEAPSKTVVLDGVGMKQESEFNGQKIISVYTDKGGWMVNSTTRAKAESTSAGCFITTRPKAARWGW